MSIQKISKEQLRRMGNQEGLILQGCGGDPQEWLDGINQILTDEGILKKGTRFEEAYTFQHDGVTCLVFPFKEGMVIEMGRLAMWRLQTHPHFGGTWLSDYVPNRLGGFLQEQEQRIVKPDWLVSQSDFPEVRELFKDYYILENAYRLNTASHNILKKSGLLDR